MPEIAAASEKIIPAVADKDENLIPANHTPDQDYEYLNGINEIESADQPAAEESDGKIIFKFDLIGRILHVRYYDKLKKYKVHNLNQSLYLGTFVKF